MSVHNALANVADITQHSICNRVALKDCSFLSLVVLLSSVLYVHGLGFYSDDWTFLASFSNSSDQSLFGLFWNAYNAWLRSRPVQVFYLAGLYWLFGAHPLGYHMVNLVVFNTAICLFYLVLRELRLPRLLTVTVPLVYALLPHYSTDRFWVAAFQANLSMALYFLSLYSDLRVLRSRLALWGWKLLSIVSLLGSTLAYEVALPLFLLNLLLIWYRAQKPYDSSRGTQMTRAALAVSLMSNLLALVLVAGFKALTTSSRSGIDSSFVNHMTRMAKHAIAVNYGYYGYGLGLPFKVWRILHDYPNGVIFAVGGVLGLVIFRYLYRIARQPETGWPSKANWFKFIALGLVVFGLGYAVFLTNTQIIFTTTGIGNRVAIAAALGVAMSLVGGLAWVIAHLPSELLRRRSFCLLVALLCVCGFLVTNTLASFWVTAYSREQEILADIREQIPTLPAGSTLILDGVCPYVGPAIVFESNWDLAGALQMSYRDLTLRADVVTPNLEIENEGLSTLLYGGLYKHYPYSEKLLLYHFGRKMIYQLPDSETARSYFQTFNSDRSSGCLEGFAGRGVKVF